MLLEEHGARVVLERLEEVEEGRPSGALTPGEIFSRFCFPGLGAAAKQASSGRYTVREGGVRDETPGRETTPPTNETTYRVQSSLAGPKVRTLRKGLRRKCGRPTWFYRVFESADGNWAGLK